MAVFGLDLAGLVLALLIGSLIYFLAGLPYLLLLITFLFLSLYITSLGYRLKISLRIYDYERGWLNVFSNGFFPFLFAALGTPIAYVGSIAAVTADKFASELGVLSEENPVQLFNWKKVKKGTSGAVTAVGTAFSFIGALSIGFLAIHIFGLAPVIAIKLAIAGFLGNIADSVAGYWEEKGIGNKGTSNLICSLVGGLLGILFVTF